MASFGESLRQERLRRQITLEQVAEVTKITPRFLQAIEDERLQDLPGGVFNRNFIRTYARYLGLDEDHYVEDYIQSTGDAARTSELPIVHEPVLRDPMVSGTTLLGVLIAAVVALGIWAGIHLYLEQQQSKRIEARAAEHSTAVTPAPAVKTPARQLIAPPRVSANGVQAQTPAAPAQPQAKPAQQTATAATQPSSPVSGPAVASSTPAFTPQSAPAGERALIVAATVQPAWISVFTDGHWRLETTLKAGEQKEVFFHSRVQVNSGNAGATAITIDGKPMGTLGKIGMVAHFNWPPQSADAGAASSSHPAAATGLRSTSHADASAPDASASQN